MEDERVAKASPKVGAEGSPARGSGAEALTGREPLTSFHLSSLSGFCRDHFTDGLRFGQTPLTLNVTLPRTYSPELASPVGTAGALGTTYPGSDWLWASRSEA